MYHPVLGEFLSRDPLPVSRAVLFGASRPPRHVMRGATENLYAYVGNNPINWVDPSGLQASEPQPLDQHERDQCMKDAEDALERCLATIESDFDFKCLNRCKKLPPSLIGLCIYVCTKGEASVQDVLKLGECYIGYTSMTIICEFLRLTPPKPKHLCGR